MTLVKAGFVVLDCAEPEKLSVFYKELLDGEQTGASASLVEIRGADGVRLAFRRDVNATSPSWPRPENSLQVHLDFLVEDLDAAERRVVELGGRPIEAKDTPGPGVSQERGCSDPAGHSFTLRLARQRVPKQG